MDLLKCGKNKTNEVSRMSKPSLVSALSRTLACLEVPMLVVVPLVLVVCALLQVEYAALLSIVVAVAALAVFFAGYEISRPALRQIMPVTVLSALAVAGRILFAAIPDVKPVSAICILSGAVFGRRSGFMAGALSALISNFFFGQGPWTPWQMYAWGLVGYLAGILAERGLFKRRGVVLVYGFLSALLYGVVLNAWYVIGFVHPVTPSSVILAFLAAIPFDIAHGIATVVFLLALYIPWHRKLTRIRRKFALVQPDG